MRQRRKLKLILVWVSLARRSLRPELTPSGTTTCMLSFAERRRKSIMRIKLKSNKERMTIPDGRRRRGWSEGAWELRQSRLCAYESLGRGLLVLGTNGVVNVGVAALDIYIREYISKMNAFINVIGLRKRAGFSLIRRIYACNLFIYEWQPQPTRYQKDWWLLWGRCVCPRSYR